MYVVRNIMFCRPGKARPMVQKFLEIDKLGRKMGMGPTRVMTDVSTERFWMVVAEMEVDSLEKHAEMMQQAMQMKEFQDVMKDYHDLVMEGRREIYQLEK
jgi:hypothetical protein